MNETKTIDLREIMRSKNGELKKVKALS